MTRLRLGALVVFAAASAGGLAGGAVTHFMSGGGEPASMAPPSAAAPGIPDLPGIISLARKSVVFIDVSSRSVNSRGESVTTRAAGSGFAIDAHGLIATNAHVVAGAGQVAVTLPDGSTVMGTLVGADETADLAVVRVETTGLVPVDIGRSASLSPGEMVLTLGNALALPGGPTASLGIVSALERIITTTDGQALAHLIQTDAAINEGGSGGPLINAAGEVIGISTVGATDAENIGFAIPIDRAMPILRALIESAP